MRRTYVILGVLLILGSTFAIEYYANSRFPTETFDEIDVPDYTVGETHMWSYLKNFEPVGTYSYMISDVTDDTYTMDTETYVSYEGTEIRIYGNYTFDDTYHPIEFKMTVESNGELVSTMRSSIENGNITLIVGSQDNPVVFTEPISEDTLLIEYNMPGFWEILFQSIELRNGVRYQANLFIPQGGTVYEVDLVVDTETSNLNFDGNMLTVTVVKIVDLDLMLYLYEGELIMYRDTNLDVEFRKIL